MLLHPIDTKREILVAENIENAITFASLRIISHAQKQITTHGRFSIALSGGTTPLKLYEKLLTSEASSKVRWSSVDVFWSDERCVPPDHKDSNYGQAKHYFDKEPLDEATLIPMRGDALDLKKEAERYENEIKKHCLEERIDLTLLGIGDDCHTASLFPETEALSVEDKLVVNNYVPQKNISRLTLTFPCINNSRRIMVLAFGHDKAKALREALYGSPNVDKFPAQNIGKGSGTALFIVDKAAASELPITNLL